MFHGNWILKELLVGRFDLCLALLVLGFAIKMVLAVKDRDRGFSVALFAASVAPLILMIWPIAPYFPDYAPRVTTLPYSLATSLAITLMLTPGSFLLLAPTAMQIRAIFGQPARRGFWLQWVVVILAYLINMAVYSAAHDSRDCRDEPYPSERAACNYP